MSSINEINQSIINLGENGVSGTTGWIFMIPTPYKSFLKVLSKATILCLPQFNQSIINLGGKWYLRNYWMDFHDSSAV
jgi:hypothetical protein